MKVTVFDAHITLTTKC